MRPVLFFIPFLDIPLYGYGMMLCIAFFMCGWLSGRLAKREGIDPAAVVDLAFWFFASGLIGARLTFVLQERDKFFASTDSLWRIFTVWDGGLVFYGSVFGAIVGYALAHRSFLRKQGISTWKMADVLAPSIALGLALGRIGCLLSGCCFGNVACADCPAITFPFPREPAKEMVKLGYQSYAGFLVGNQNLRVIAVEPDSAAEQAGLRGGDEIVVINGIDVKQHKEPRDLLINFLFSGDEALELSVLRGGSVTSLPPIHARSLGLHPTQLYETISMVLLLFFLLSYYPYKTRDGSVMFFLMVGYAVHRYLNEMLRVDNEIVAFNMTFSQLVSIGLLVAALLLAFFIWGRRPEAPVETPPSPAPASW